MDLETKSEEIGWPEWSLADDTRMHYGSIDYDYYSLMIRARFNWATPAQRREGTQQRQMQSMIEDANRANLKRIDWGPFQTLRRARKARLVGEQNRRAHRKQKRARRRKVKLGW